METMLSRDLASLHTSFVLRRCHPHFAKEDSESLRDRATRRGLRAASNRNGSRAPSDAKSAVSGSVTRPRHEWGSTAEECQQNPQTLRTPGSWPLPSAYALVMIISSFVKVPVSAHCVPDTTFWESRAGDTVTETCCHNAQCQLCIFVSREGPVKHPEKVLQARLRLFALWASRPGRGRSAFAPHHFSDAHF